MLLQLVLYMSLLFNCKKHIKIIKREDPGRLGLRKPVEGQGKENLLLLQVPHTADGQGARRSATHRKWPRKVSVKPNRCYETKKKRHNNGMLP